MFLLLARGGFWNGIINKDVVVAVAVAVFVFITSTACTSASCASSSCSLFDKDEDDDDEAHNNDLSCIDCVKNESTFVGDGRDTLSSVLSCLQIALVTTRSFMVMLLFLLLLLFCG